MTAALIILAALLIVGAALYLHHRLTFSPDAQQEPDAQPAETEECCGMHITCEKDSLLAAVSKEIVYYDDEELDRFKGRMPDEYSDQEIEEFRDILLTLLPTDIAGWGRSLQLRGIELPAEVKDELLMIVSEERQKNTQQ